MPILSHASNFMLLLFALLAPLRENCLFLFHPFTLLFKAKIDTTTITEVIMLMADHSSLLKCNLNIGL